MKSHITPDGPKKCTDKTNRCPYISKDGEPENHFETITDARAEYDKRLRENYDEVGTIKQTYAERAAVLGKREDLLRDKNTTLAKEIVELRAAAGGITFDDANPERAKRRLDEAITFADGRYNPHLVDKLRKATVLPSGAFKMEDGTRVNTDNQLKGTVAKKHIDAERDRVLKDLTEVIRNGEDPTETKFVHKTDAGSFTLTVSENQFDEDAFNALSDEDKDRCSTLEPSFSVDQMREYFENGEGKESGLTFEELTTSSQSIDFIVGKEPDVGQENMKVSRKFEGTTTDEKLQSGVENIAKFYGDVHTSLKKSNPNSTGKVRDLKKTVDAGNNAIKTAAAKHKGNVFAPARSQFNGALVSGRVNVNKAAVEEKMNAVQQGFIRVIKPQPSKERAREVLSPEDFDRIFNAKKASLRVMEAK